MHRTQNMVLGIVGALSAVALIACQAGPEKDTRDLGDITGVEEIGQPLAAFSTIAWDAGTGALQLTFNGSETILVVGKHPVSGAITVNDVQQTATATSLKKLFVYGTGTAETVIIDFANGPFAPGVTGAGGQGIQVDLGAGANAFKMRGQSTVADVITVGGTSTAASVAFNVDAFADISVVSSGSVAYTYSLGGGNDTFTGSTSQNGVTAPFTGALTVYGGAGDDTLTGGTGADALNGDEGNDTMNGGPVGTEIDTYSGGNNADAGTGTDTVTYATRTGSLTISVGLAGAGNEDGEAGEQDDIKSDVEVIQGGSAADTFINTAGVQTFRGGAGNDTFNMGAPTVATAADILFGEAGTDVVSFAARTAGVTINLTATATSGVTGENITIQADIENVTCPTSALATCAVTGSSSDNTVTVGAGVCTFAGGAGDDTMIVGSGFGAAHEFTGGAGLDRINFSSLGAAVNLVMDNSAATAPAGLKVATDVENLTCPTGTACTVTGNALNNNIIGSSAVDTISGGDGDDFIESLAGADVIDCGSGSDILLDSAGPDVGPAMAASPLACEL